MWNFNNTDDIEWNMCEKYVRPLGGLHLVLKNNNCYYLLWSCCIQHQLSQVLKAITAHRNIITSLQVGPLSPNFLRLSALAGPLLATFAPLQSHQKTLAHFYCSNQLLARNNTSDTQSTIPKVPAPHQGCSTAHRGSEGTNNSSSTSSDHRSWCVSDDFRPVTKSTLRKTSLMKTSILSHANHVTLKLW